MTVERITDFKIFQKIKGEWNRLLFSSKRNCLFLSHEWFSSWWESFSEGNLLEVLIFRDEKGIAYGIAPFMEKEGTLHFIASQEVSDYCDFISLKERRQEFFEDLLAYMESNYSGMGRIALINIKSSSPTLSFLSRLSAKFNFSCSYEATEVAPYLLLPSSYDSYVSNLSRKNRHELLRKWRKINTLEGIRTKKIRRPEEIQSAVHLFMGLHQSSTISKKRFWEKKGVVRFFEEITEKFSRNGWVELNFLYLKDQLIASLLSFSYADVVYFYNIAYAKDYAEYSPGYFLFHQSIKQAIEEKIKIVDFLRGGEKYKYYFGAKDCKIYRLTLIPGDRKT